MDMTTQVMPFHQEKANFYISYHADDKKWAKWIEWSLNNIGYSTSLLNRGIQFGRNVQEEKDAATRSAIFIIAVLSAHYLKAFQSTSDWVEVFGRNKLLPVKVQTCDVNGLFAARDYIDLVGVDIDERTAHEMLSKGMENWETRHSDSLLLPQHTKSLSEHSLYVRPDYPGRNVAVQLASTASVSRFASPESQDTYDETDDNIPAPLETAPLETDSPTILQREEIVKDIYTKLTSPDTSAITLTGIGGVGKSMLASLVYRQAEKKRNSSNGPFVTKPIWLEINDEVTLIDLASNLFNAVDKPFHFHNFRKYPPRYQARLLSDVLNSTNKPLLIIMDPFEKILDLQTGHLQNNREDVAEWLDILKSQPCQCKVLLTSRLNPVGNRNNPAADYLKEHTISGLSQEEAIELLKKLEVKEEEADLLKAVRLCDNHPYALYLLAQILKDKKLSLKLLFENKKLWYDDVAKNLLNFIYTNQLNPEQRIVLLAFSIYRKDVPLEAAEAILSDKLQSGKLISSEIRNAFNVLLIQHLLQAIEGGLYRLHAIVRSYAHNHFDASSDQANEHEKKAAHGKAALYYYARHQQGSDTSNIVEAIWHYCQAGQWRIAHNLLREESTYAQIRHWGGNSILLQLYKLLIPLEKWLSLPKEGFAAAHIYGILGDLYYAQGQKELALSYSTKALDIFRTISEDGEVAKILKKLGVIYEELGNNAEAQKCYRQALDIFKKAGESEEEGALLYSLGRILRMLGDKEEARKCLVQGLAILKDSGDRLIKGRMLKLLGEIHYDMGMNGDAQQHFDKALEIFGQERDHVGEGEILNNLGLLYMALGQTEEAEKSLGQALAVHRSIVNREMEGVTLSNLGGVYKMRGNIQEALRASEEALHIHQEIGNRAGEGITLNNLGVIDNDLGDGAHALKYYKDAYYALKDADKNWEAGRTLYNIGIFHMKQPEHRAVILACLLLAKNIFEKIQSPDLDAAQKMMDHLARDMDKKAYDRLLAMCESNAQQIIEQALRDV